MSKNDDQRSEEEMEKILSALANGGQMATKAFASFAGWTWTRASEYFGESEIKMTKAEWEALVSSKEGTDGA